MANTIILKQSSVPSKVPVPGDLELGELAVNTTDGKLYMKNGTGTVVEVGAYTVGLDLGEFSVAGLPTASDYNGYSALATNASGGRTVVRSDGTNWKVIAVEGATVTV